MQNAESVGNGGITRKCAVHTQADVAGVQESTEAEVPFLGAIGSERRNPWEVTISLNKKPVKFQIDSGAEVTVVPDSMLRKLTGVNLKPTQRTLKGAHSGYTACKRTVQGNASVWRSRISAGHLCGQETSQATVGPASD